MPRRLLPALALLPLLSGCATGAPAGGMMAARGHAYRPLSPASAPRGVPGGALAARRVEPDAPARAEPRRREPTPRRPATPARDEVRPAAPQPTSRERVVTLAGSQVGRTQVVLGGRTWPADCTGIVEGVLAQVGLRVRGPGEANDNGVTLLYRWAQAHGRVFTGGRPLPGDLVFFRETYDQNRDGRRNDGLTHVGLVEEVDAGGTVTVIHRVSRGVVRYRMNLARPHLVRDPQTGAVLNDRLRAAGPGRPQVLTGQLFAAYASVLPVGGVELAGR